MAAGVCYRLWSPSARLEKATSPELHRESLVPLVLGAAAWGARVEELPWLDAPKPYALAAARADLAAWGAVDERGALSEGGRALYALPLEPLHGRLLLSARREGCLEDMIDLVATLSVGRPLFATGGIDQDAPEDLRSAGCDASARILALRTLSADETSTSQAGVSSFVLREARLARARLRRAEGLADLPPERRPPKREALVRAALAADPRVAHVARPRGRDLYFSNGGTEIELARESALRNLRSVEAVLVLDTRAFGSGRDAKVLVTCGMAVPLSALARAGLGSDQLGNVRLERGQVIVSVERVYAKRVIAERTDTPSGALLRSALAVLLARGSLFREAVATSTERLARTALAAQVAARSQPGNATPPSPAPEIEVWLLSRLEALGVESADDLALLSASDFLAPELPYELQRTLEQDFPSSINVGDATYRAEYDLAQNQVILSMVKGSRTAPPPLAYLPRFPGLRICVEGPRGISVLRARG
jgi:HrpA-like RNA helicase